MEKHPRTSLSTDQDRVQRYFSEAFKVKKVREIEQNLSTVLEISREYCVSSNAIYKWVYKYSSMRKKGIKQVIEAKSDTRKIAQLKEQVKEIQRVVGEKQIMIEFLEKVIELAENEYGVDIKKKFSSSLSNGSGRTGKRTRSK